MNNHLPLYLCHKKVRAAKIISIDTERAPEGGANLILESLTSRAGEMLPVITVDSAWLQRNPALDIGGYFVEYQEGDKYTAYSPAGPFKSGYKLIEVAEQADKKMTVAPCGCDTGKGIVCQACENTAQKVIDDGAEYINDFIKKRFPSGLDGDIRQIISECVLDAFFDGARWSEQTRHEEAEQEKSPIILA